MSTRVEQGEARSKVVFLNRYFHPDHSATAQMLSDLAFGLADDGHRVEVITSRMRYDVPDAILPKTERIGGVDVRRVATTRFGRHNLAGRAIDYLTFYLSAAWALYRAARRGDVVVAKTDPPMLGVLAGPIARWRGAHAVNWLQDLFPEVAQSLGIGRGRLSRLGYRVLLALRDHSLRHAAANVVLGERMAETLDGHGIDRRRVRAIPNWADSRLIVPIADGDNPLRRAWNLEGKFVVGYSGNLGRAHDYETLLAAIAAIESEKKPADLSVSWLFIGGGAQFDAFAAEVRARALKSVMFQPYQPREMLASSLSAADVHLVTLRPEMEGLIVPSKFYGIAAAGRPTVFVGDLDGEIARLLGRFGCGVTVRQGDGEALAAAVRTLARDPDRCRDMGNRARQACERHFDRRIALAAWRKLIEELGAGKPTG